MSREEQREQTRARLYDAAMAEFGRVGTAKAQISDIAKAAGFAYGSFYVHFESKEAVLHECARRASQRIAEILRTSPADGTLREFLKRVARLYIEVDIEFPELREEVWTSSVRQFEREENEHPMMVEVARHIEVFQERGLVSRERPALLFAAAYLTSLIGVLVRSSPEKFVPAVMDTIVDVFSVSLSN